MQQRFVSAFHCDKTALLDRKRNIELWEADIQAKRYIVKSFLSPRHSPWPEFEEQSRIGSSILLRPTLAGFSKKGIFCHAMPAEFKAEPLSPDTDLTSFVIQFLALAAALEKAGLQGSWDANHVIKDPCTGRVLLAGFNRVRHVAQESISERALATINELRKVAGACQCAPAVVNLLKRWERRKEIELAACLKAVMKEYPYALESLATSFEWIHSKEIEIVAGLFQLASRSRGRTVLFVGERGEGKSTMLRQLYRHLSARNCIVTHRAAHAEDGPLQSFRALMDSFFEVTSAYTLHKKAADPLQFLQLFDRPTQRTPEQIISRFSQLITRLSEKMNSVFVFCIDDVHLFDNASRDLCSELFARMDALPLLFLMTASSTTTTVPDVPLTLALQPGRFRDFDRTHVVPLWKPEQRQLYLEQIYKRTSGNPLLYAEYLHQTLRQRQSQLSWDDGTWAFQQPEIPAFPNVLLEFHLQQIPPISAGELSFLELASIQGETFDPTLCETDPETRAALLQSLREKSVLHPANGLASFCKPLLSEALHERIDATRRQRLHREVAAELMKANKPEQAPVIAHHFLKSGDYASALTFASQAAQERPAAINPLLPIFEELDRVSDRFDGEQRLQLFQARGGLFFRRGNYSAALENLTKAFALQGADQEQQFVTAIRIAQSHLLNNDIFSAQKVLQEQGSHLHLVTDQHALLDFYLARAFCGWHRGERFTQDFDHAMQIAEKLQDYNALASGYRQHAELTLKEGTSNEARMLAEKAMKYCRKTGNTEELGQCLRILGAIFWRQSNYKMAEQVLKKSIRLLQKIQNQESVARAWSVLGNVYSERYQFRKAIEAFQNAARLFNQERHPYEMSLAQFNLGLVYVDQGNLKEGERIFTRCRMGDKQTGNKRFLAYDLRALAVVCILRGFYKKAARLLKRTLEICEDLNAEGDILQTKMLLLFNELEQRNFRQSAGLVEFIQNNLQRQDDQKTRAEMHYLLAHYYGFINDAKKSVVHLESAVKIARSLRCYKLLAQCLILKLIFRNASPSRTDADLKRAITYFRRSRNELEFCMYILKLYQAYPALAKLPEHSRRLMRMEGLYRQIRHRINYRAVKQLLRGSPLRSKKAEGTFEWPAELLEILSNKKPLAERLPLLLKRMMEELNASTVVFRYLNETGVFEKISLPSFSNMVEDLESRVFPILLQKREAWCESIDPASEFSKHPWTILSDVTSILVIPVISANQITGCWYFERHGERPPFARTEQSKATFFLLAAMPVLEQAMKIETANRSKNAPLAHHAYGDLIGDSKPMRELYVQMAKAAPVDISVLITGQSGTGKELVARTVHRNSSRSRASFLALNCSALPETLIESELFGYNKGAFTGAVSNKIGLIERANGGTLFLDEVGDLSLAAQAKLLRVMQEREIQRLGDTSVRKVDVRFLFATHKDLKRMVKEGTYREDLLYRISVYTLLVPALRDRSEDIPLLLRYFTGKYCQSFGKSQVGFSAAALRALCEYSWPGNVRELENIIQMLLVNADPGTTIDASDLPAHITSNEGIQKLRGKGLDEARREFEKEFLLSVLKNNNWNKTHAARELKITRQGLVNLLNRLEISDSDR